MLKRALLISISSLFFFILVIVLYIVYSLYNAPAPQFSEKSILEYKVRRDQSRGRKIIREKQRTTPDLIEEDGPSLLSNRKVHDFSSPFSKKLYKICHRKEIPKYIKLDKKECLALFKRTTHALADLEQFHSSDLADVQDTTQKVFLDLMRHIVQVSPDFSISIISRGKFKTKSDLISFFKKEYEEDAFPYLFASFIDDELKEGKSIEKLDPYAFSDKMIDFTEKFKDLNFDEMLFSEEHRAIEKAGHHGP